jgi:hypothetical protein
MTVGLKNHGLDIGRANVQPDKERFVFHSTVFPEEGSTIDD